MKKEYIHPDVEIVRFSLADILTASEIGQGDGIRDTLEDVENPDPWQ